jgi:hypothetical protein
MWLYQMISLFGTWRKVICRQLHEPSSTFSILRLDLTARARISVVRLTLSVRIMHEAYSSIPFSYRSSLATKEL